MVLTPYGRAASEALLGEIARAKQVSPLAPVTVIVPGNSVGVAVRRLLASGELGAVSTVGTGLIGVNFLTASRLAELLAAPRLAASGRRPVSAPVVAAAVRRVLAVDGAGMFAPVATHPATEEALVAASWELSDLDDASLDVLAAQSERAREVVRIHRQVKRHLEVAWYDEHDLMRAAHDVVGEGSPLVAELGTVVYHLPQRTSSPVARLLRAIAARNELVTITALTGVAKADAEVTASVTRLGGAIDADSSGVVPAHGTAVWSMSDADDEARVIVRGVVDAMREGVPLERMAVVFGNAEPYARLLHDHLELAGIAHNGVSVRTLADSVLGRSLLRLLALVDHDFRREDVCALMAGVPLLDGRGRPVEAAVWERISRDAGVVGGVAQWKARLDRYLAGLPESDSDSNGTPSWVDIERSRATALQDFIARLAADLERAPRSWSEMARWARRIVARWIGEEDRRVTWSPFEQEAARRVDAAIERLGGLDSVEASPTLEVFRRSLALELDASRDRVGRLGEGLLVGPAVLALGVELERLWVCGLAEGVFPAAPRDDPLLADADRAALAGEMRLRSDRIADDQRALLAALANTTGARVLCFSRGDLRRNTEHVPSRFLLDTVEALSGSRGVGSVLPVSEPWWTTVPSFVHGLVHAPFPATRHELDVRAALAHEPWIAALPGVARSLALARARRSADFTRFDGNLAHLRERIAARSPAAAGVEVSATRLETWARCPHAYFAIYLLHVSAIERPEEILQISPLERGNVVHHALDHFLSELIGTPGIGRPWSVAHRERLHAILRDACDEVEASGLGGRRLLWERARREMHAQFDAFLDYDGGYRDLQGAETIATELGFGRRDGSRPAIEINCSDGRTLRLAGSIDRIDRLGDGRLAVIDYKSGGASSYQKLSHENPLLDSRRLQLPLYAHAARSVLGADPHAEVEASYWFVKDLKGSRGYAVDLPVEEALDRALISIVDGIESGVFVHRPPAPGGWHGYIECPYCDPDGLGTADRHRDWLRKVGAPELAGYRDLLGIELAAVEP